MLHTIATWLCVAAFLGAGVSNAIGTAATRRSFVNWGYPAWWSRVTGALEIAAAVAIAFPATQAAGLVLGAVIIAGAAATLLRHREFSHLPPVGVFVALLAFAAITL